MAKKVETDALRAIKFSTRSGKIGKVHCGGYEMVHKPSCYGVAIKWILYIKKISYESFAKRLGNTTAQSVNHTLNRVPKEKFIEEDLRNMCKILEIKFDYFDKLCQNIEILMQGDENG